MTDIDRDLLELLEGLWDRPPLAEAESERRVRELLLDTLGCAIGGFALPEVRALARSFSLDDRGPYSLVGMSGSVSKGGFVLLFAAASCALEACEGLALAHGRPGLHAIPPALAGALGGDKSLGDVLDAIIMGYEVGGRLGHVCRVKAGMHVDGTWGSYAAAAAESRLRRLPPGGTLEALSHAACHLPYSLYRPIAFGSDARNLYVGHGALHGIASAAAAAAGFGGPPGSIAEHLRLALGIDPAGLDRAIPNEERLLLQGYLKKYPAVKHVHYGIEAGARWHLEHGNGERLPDRVRLEVYGEAITYCGNRAPVTPIQAQFSLSYGLAWSLLNGPLVAQAYLRESLENERVRQLESRIEIAEARDMTQSGTRGCRLLVECQGSSWNCAIDRVSGDVAQPMSRAEIVAKFHALTDPVVGAENGDRIVEAILEGALEALMDCAALRGSVRGAAPDSAS